MAHEGKMRREVPSVDDMARYEETHFFESFQKSERAQEKAGFKMRVVSGRSNLNLALDICKVLEVELLEMGVKEAKNQELSMSLEEDIQGQDVYYVQTLCERDAQSGKDTDVDLNSSCMELLFALHYLRLQGAARVTAIVPYYAYSRQDRKIKPRVPIAASALASLIQCVGVDRLVTVDLHRGQVQGFFHNCPVDNLPTHMEFAKYIKGVVCAETGVTNPSEELTIIAPDAWGVERARVVANSVMARSVCTVLKRQVKDGVRHELVGDVSGQVCVVVDDIVDTGVVVSEACNLVHNSGAKAVYAVVTHGVLSDTDQVKACAPLKRLIVTDSVNLQDKTKALGSKLHIITIAPMLAQAIYRCHHEISLAAVFN